MKIERLIDSYFNYSPFAHFIHPFFGYLESYYVNPILSYSTNFPSRFKTLSFLKGEGCRNVPLIYSFLIQIKRSSTNYEMKYCLLQQRRRKGFAIILQYRRKKLLMRQRLFEWKNISNIINLRFF